MAVKKYEDPGTHRTKLYSIWCGMRQRCGNPNNKDFQWYGAAGIMVCPEWSDFNVFRDWALRSGYAEGLTIDRKNGREGYSPTNCRWITIQAQQRNRRDVRLLTHRGETHCLQEWAEITGLKRETIRDRLKSGWTVSEAMTLPLHSKRGGNI